MANRPTDSLREIVFGVEDGMLSTMGVITGIASGTHDTPTVILAGLVIISVESLSMAAGTYLSNKTEEQYLASQTKIPLHKRLHLQSIKNVKADAVFMGIAYIVGGLVPITPYLFLPVRLGGAFSIVATILGLMTVGVIKAKLTHSKVLRSVVEMLIVSLTAASVGYGIGKTAAFFFPQLRQVGI